jgi:uncharacterized protein
MRRFVAGSALRALLPLVLLLASGAPARAETPIPPAPARWVTDRAAFLSPAAVAALDARLGAYQQKTGHQLLVYVDHTTGGVPIEDWGVRAFKAWRVGRQGIDDGLVLFVFADDHRVRIEVGYGLEGPIPDALAKRIIEERIVPRMRAGDPDGAIRAGVDALTATLGGEGAPGAQPGKGVMGQAPQDARDDAPAPMPLWKLIAGALALVALLGFLITHPSLAWLLLLNIGGGGRGGGWGGGGGGGGGFSGGGGRSGGGGASGSW